MRRSIRLTWLTLGLWGVVVGGPSWCWATLPIPLSLLPGFPLLPPPMRRAWRGNQDELSSSSSSKISLHNYLSETMARIEDLELGAMLPSLPFSDKDVNNVRFYLYTSPSPVVVGSSPGGGAESNAGGGGGVDKSSGDESGEEGRGSEEGLPEELFVNDIASVNASSFHTGNPVKVLIHGWSMSIASKDFPGPLKDAYLDWYGSRPANIVVVDWSALSREFLYFNSVLYAEKVGRRVGEFLMFLRLAGFIPSFADVHLVGFSLGAHVAAISGHFIVTSTNSEELVGRISGLDPAGPGFPSEMPLSHRLDSSDAAFVDVIHTNMGQLIKGEFGSPLSSGSADFYPNGGHKQPGCELSLLREWGVPRRSGCHHMKAIDYFISSLKAPQAGCKCRDWVTFSSGGCNCALKENRAWMGEHCEIRARGKYYLHAH
ncbi:endothelial lipase-like [Folsomia candida]|uniref:endothelial lipase-like n=1 Tax=Folsomia candida TaxID=158441 RepID=UPI001605555B|nr:endothelial lipase-like [Folsomia candida]